MVVFALNVIVYNLEERDFPINSITQLYNIILYTFSLINMKRAKRGNKVY